MIEVVTGLENIEPGMMCWRAKKAFKLHIWPDRAAVQVQRGGLLALNAEALDESDLLISALASALARGVLIPVSGRVN